MIQTSSNKKWIIKKKQLIWVILAISSSVILSITHICLSLALLSCSDDALKTYERDSDPRGTVTKHVDKPADVVAKEPAYEPEPLKHYLPEDALERVEMYFNRNLKSVRYMEQDCECTTYRAWDKFPLKKCRYRVRDSDGALKLAEVIMLNPSAEQLSRWVVYTCMEVKGKADEKCTNSISNWIVEASGAQYPVAGIVFEDEFDKDGKKRKDGIKEVYCFRNGVTVGIKGVKHRMTRQPTEEEIDKSLYGEVIWTGIYARIQSTTREQYKANGGTVDVGTSSRGNRKLIWLDVSRDLYQTAWGNDRNELMIAWGKENL